MLNFGEKSKYRELKTLLSEAGYSFRIRDGQQVYNVANEAAMQLIIDNYDPIPDRRAKKIEELKSEGLSRVQLVYPAISSFDDLQLVRDQFLSIAPAARQPTVDFQKLIDIYQAGTSAATVINGLTDMSVIDAYDVVNTPGWP